MVTFEINRRWTFVEAKRPYGVQLTRYLGVQGFGFASNFAIYAAVYQVAEPRATAPLLALGIASAAALLVNYVGAKLFVFSSRLRQPRMPDVDATRT